MFFANTLLELMQLSVSWTSMPILTRNSVVFGHILQSCSLRNEWRESNAKATLHDFAAPLSQFFRLNLSSIQLNQLRSKYFHRPNHLALKFDCLYELNHVQYTNPIYPLIRHLLVWFVIVTHRLVVYRSNYNVKAHGLQEIRRDPHRPISYLQHHDRPSLESHWRVIVLVADALPSNGQCGPWWIGSKQNPRSK